MAIRLDCPRCKEPLAAPNATAGTYVRCPRCNGRLWVAKDAPADATALDRVVAAGEEMSRRPAAPAVAAAIGKTAAGAPTAPKAAPPGSIPPGSFQPGGGLSGSLSPGSGPLGSLPPGSVPSGVLPHVAQPPAAPMPGPSIVPPPPSSGAAPPRAGATAWIAPAAPAGGASRTASPSSAVVGGPSGTVPIGTAPAAGPATVAPPPGTKTARFVTPESVTSRLQPAPDGKLPSLQLREPGEKQASEPGSRGLNPLLLTALLGASVCLSMALVLLEPGGGEPDRAERQAVARRIIEDEYFGSMDGNVPIQPHEKLLREAQREYLRGDRAAERRLYREVLRMLRAERAAASKGLTGSRARDERLEEQITILLSDS